MTTRSHSPQDEIAAARAAWVAFVADMHAWERPAHEALTGFFSSPGPKTLEALEALRASVREHLRHVLDAAGVAGAKNRERLENLSTGDPCDYHPVTVAIVKEEVVPGGVRIYADKADGLHDQWRFTLARRDGRWILAKKEVLRHTGRWAAIPF